MRARLLTYATIMAVVLGSGMVYAQAPFGDSIVIPLDYGKLIATMGERDDSLRGGIFDWLAPADSIEQLSDEAFANGIHCGEDRDFASADFNGDGMDEIAMAWNRSDGGVFVGIVAYDLVNMIPTGWHAPDPPIDAGVLYATETLAGIHGEIRVVDGNFYDDEASEFVLAYLAADGTVTITVYDIATPGLTPEAKASVSDQPIHTAMPQVQRFGTASRFDVTTGDLDNDGTDEIILVSSHPDHSPDTDLWVAVYDYDPGANSIFLQLEANLPDANPFTLFSWFCLRRVVAVTGNFDADPQDEVAVMHDWANNDVLGDNDLAHMMGCQVFGFDSDITLLNDITDFPFDYGANDGLINWDPVTSLNNNVHALTVYKGDLIAGGAFNKESGGTKLLNYIARWDGAGWRPLGSGMNHYVNALTVYNGDLIAGGRFTNAGGNTTYGIARWDGADWHIMNPEGTSNDIVRTLTVYDGELIAGGEFASMDYVSSPRIARWDGSQWQAMTSSVNGNIIALAVYHDTLIVGGAFTYIDGIEVNRIARWDGQSQNWSALGSGMNDYVRALTVYNDQLIAGGTFTTAGGGSALRVARWNGYVWDQPGEGFNNGEVYSLATFNLASHDEVLAAGGTFTDASTYDGIRAAWFATDEWHAFDTIGSGPGAAVIAMAEYDGDLILGGDFTFYRRLFSYTGEEVVYVGGICRVKPEEDDGRYDSLRARCDFPIDIVAKDIDHEPGSPDELIMLFYTSRTGGPSTPYNALAVASIDTTTGSFYGRGFTTVTDHNWGIDGMYGSRHVLDVADFTGDDQAGDGIKPDEAIVLASDFNTVSIKAYELHPDSLIDQSSEAPLTGTWATPISKEMTELIVADLDTATIKLCNWTCDTIETVLQPVVILNIPPVHYDILDGTIWDISKRYDGSSDPDYVTNCSYFNLQSFATTVKTEVRKDWGISAGLQTHFSSCGATVKAHLNTNYGEGFAIQGENLDSIVIVQERTVHLEDQVLAASVIYEVWEYEVYQRGEQLIGGNVLVVNPIDVDKSWLTGKNIESYVADHEVENIFSYPQYMDLSDNPMVASAGVISGIGWEMVAGDTGNFDLTYSSFNTQTVEESNNFGMEVGASIGYEGGLRFFGLGATFGVEVSVEGSYNRSEINTYTTSFTESDNLHVRYGEIVSGSSFEENRNYWITPYVYWAKNGALVLDYAVQPKTNPQGEDPTWWQVHYSDPDPAFILPWRLDPEKDTVESNENRFKTREIVFIPSYPDPDYDDTVLIIARVHNFSLSATDGPVQVSFYLGDPDNFGQLLYDKNTGDSLFYGCDADGFPAAIASQGEVAAQMVWQVPSEGNITSCQRIWALIDPLDSITLEVHDNNDAITNNKGWARLDVITTTECIDRDGDGWEESAYRCCDGLGQWDNCPDVYNPDQTDTDGDGIGDACETVVLICGDASGDETLNVGDAVYLINYIFKGGPAPNPLCEGDASGDDTINVGDAVYLINYIFKGGPAPVEPCCP